MALTLQQKRNKADVLFNRLYLSLSSFFRDNGFIPVPSQKINIPKFDELDIFLRVEGVSKNVTMDLLVENLGSYYKRSDVVIDGVRQEGEWAAVQPVVVENLLEGPPYSIRVGKNIYVTF